MPRQGFVQVGLLLSGLALVSLLAASVQAAEDPRTAQQFLQGLRERGLHDLALEFIDQIRTDPAMPAELKVVLDYQEGRMLIDEASKTGDLARRRDLLQQARTKLDNFAKTQPNHPLSREALVQIARMLIERGHVALLLADESQDAAVKAAKQAEARNSFTEAKTAYDKAAESLEQARKNFPISLPRGDPRIEERDRLYVAYLDTILQKAIADYELAQTYPAGSKERTANLATALKQFDALNKAHRREMAGLTAQMWQAKCYEEEGKIGEAIGIYKSLLEHTDLRLHTLQRVVSYYYIVALAKRKQHVLATDMAETWLKTYSKRDELRSQEGMGVLLELAKNLDAQMADSATPVDSAERRQKVKRITDAVSQVVRYASPYKNDALALLKKYKPSAAARAEEVARLTYEDAFGQAEDAIAAREWDRAALLLKAAIRKADPRRDIDKANRARYNLAFCYYMNQEFYEAYVLAEHLARRYPQGGLSSKAVEIGMQALADAYNTYTEIDRGADLENLINLAKYTTATWPDREQGDDAHINLGLIYQGRGQYDQAIAEFDAVGERSPKKIQAQTRLGAARWAKSRMLDRRGDKEKAAAEAQLAIDLLDKTMKTRQAGGAGATDAGLIGNTADLAVALTETGKAKEALALLDPINQAQTSHTGPAFARLEEAVLLAQINVGNVEPAIATMKALEESGSGAGRAQLYFKLGKLLETELDKLKAKKDMGSLKRMQDFYKSFLTALTESKAGQTYESLQWAGESLLSLGASQEAETVLRRVLAEAINNPSFKDQAGQQRILRTRLKLAAALRSQGVEDKKKLDEAASLVEELLSQYSRYIEPLLEKGMLLEAEAEARRAEWPAVLGHWQDLAQRLSRSRPRPMAFYDAWYHAAWALYKQKQTTKARQTLAGVMRLNPDVGSPEMKAKYEQFLARIK